jgi:hypothetical protein
MAKIKELSVVLSRKVRKGSIKVSEADLPSLQVGIVDDVVVTPIGKNEGVSEMLFSDSKVQSGFVLIGVGDAEVIGVEEGDRVTVEKLSSIQSDNKPVTPEDKNNADNQAKQNDAEI